MNKLQKFTANLPSIFQVGINPNITALIQAWATEDDNIVTQLANTNDQLFVATATGIYLDRLASNYGVSRPLSLSLQDSDFQQLIPILSLKPKQIRKTMVDLMDIVWGPTATRANVQTLNFEPFNVVVGDIITIQVDGQAPQSYTAQTGDITNGAATAAQIVDNIFSHFSNVTAIVYTDIQTEKNYVNVRTNTIGAAGSIQIPGTGMNSPSKLNFPTSLVQIQNIQPHAAIFEIRNKELLFEIPALVPLLKRTLLGSHHWHATQAEAPPEPPDEGVWVGSFLYNNPEINSGFTITGQVASLQQFIQAGQVYVQIIANNASNLPNQTGYLIFDFGLSTQEGPIQYFGIPNSNIIFLNPQHIFQFNHSIGSNINYISSLSSYTPRTDGADYGIYLTDPVGARDTAEQLLESLIAAGVIATFDILLPQYLYPLVPNPYGV